MTTGDIAVLIMVVTFFSFVLGTMYHVHKTTVRDTPSTPKPFKSMDDFYDQLNKENITMTDDQLQKAIEYNEALIKLTQGVGCYGNPEARAHLAALREVQLQRAKEG